MLPFAPLAPLAPLALFPPRALPRYQQITKNHEYTNPFYVRSGCFNDTGTDKCFTNTGVSQEYGVNMPTNYFIKDDPEAQREVSKALFLHLNVQILIPQFATRAKFRRAFPRDWSQPYPPLLATAFNTTPHVGRHFASLHSFSGCTLLTRPARPARPAQVCATGRHVPTMKKFTDKHPLLGWQFTGLQRTGLFRNWPLIYQCRTEFQCSGCSDSRFRGWYASSVSGPKGKVAAPPPLLQHTHTQQPLKTLNTQTHISF